MVHIDQRLQMVHIDQRLQMVHINQSASNGSKCKTMCPYAGWAYATKCNVKQCTKYALNEYT